MWFCSGKAVMLLLLLLFPSRTAKSNAFNAHLFTESGPNLSPKALSNHSHFQQHNKQNLR